LLFNGITVAPIQSVSSANAGFVLVGQTANTTVTVTNKGHGNLDTAVAKSVSNLNGSAGAGNSVFVGNGGTLKNAVETGLRDGTSETFTYVFTPTKQSTTSSTINVLTKFTNGNSSGDNSAQTVTTTLSGQGVAPVQQLSSTSPVYARAGGSSVTSTVAIKNIGNGNLDTAVAQSVSNLNGTVGAIAGTSWTGGVQTFSLQDSASQTFNYSYGPQARGASSSGALSVAFTNGNSDLSNKSQTVPVTLIGNTVGPVFKSTWPGSTNNTPPANGTSATKIDFGTVGAGSHTQALTLANISTDLNGGDHTLTDLTIESFTITGTGASKFSINGKQSGSLGTVLAEGGGSTLVNIGFSATTSGVYNALLTFVTDQDAAFGALGDTFSYQLTSLAAIAPEPASMLLLSVGIGGMLIVRRRRRQL
jgi:hypothetical protein